MTTHRPHHHTPLRRSLAAARACLLPALLLAGSAIVLGACSDDTGGTSSDTTAELDTAQDAQRVDTEDATVEDVEPPTGPYHIYLTAAPISGDPGGVEGADLLCDQDAGALPGRSYRALLGASTRYPCTSANCAEGADPRDWVLAADTDYMLSDGEVIFTTNALAIITDYPMNSELAGQGLNFWSGLDGDWTLAANNCADWTTMSADSVGAVGWDQTTGEGWLQGGELSCDVRRSLACVEER